RAIRFSFFPRRSTSRRTLSAFTIRLTRSRLEQVRQRSRLRQNPLRQRLSRLLRSPNERSFSRQFELRQNASGLVGSVLFFHVSLRAFLAERALRARSVANSLLAKFPLTVRSGS